jgi:hypothetical protein
LRGGVAAPNSAPILADNRPNAIPVDTELVLAVDVSYSMEPEEQALQREGYITGLTSREFMQALKGGMHGKVAVTYFEWAGPGDQRVVMPWRLIDGPETADAAADVIARAPYRRAMFTSIASALQFAKPLFDASGYHGLRRVIDVSGDGTNNSSPLLVPVRDDVLAAGICINGLPIMLTSAAVLVGYRELDIYEDCVIGGQVRSSFRSANAQFKDAVHQPLEIAGRTPEQRVIPVQARAPRISCTIGEEMRRQRWGN